MPLPVIPPALLGALGALCAAALGKLLIKEWQRVNGDLDKAKAAMATEPTREKLPKLRRDPKTGIYRP